MMPRSPTTLLAPPLLATRPRLLRPIEPRLAARLDAIAAIPQPQSSPDSRPARNAVLSEQLQPAHHRPPQRSSSRPDVDLTSHDAIEAAVLDLRSPLLCYVIWVEPERGGRPANELDWTRISNTWGWVSSLRSRRLQSQTISNL